MNVAINLNEITSLILYRCQLLYSTGSVFLCMLKGATSLCLFVCFLVVWKASEKGVLEIDNYLEI